MALRVARQPDLPVRASSVTDQPSHRSIADRGVHCCCGGCGCGRDLQVAAAPHRRSHRQREPCRSKPGEGQVCGERECQQSARRRYVGAVFVLPEDQPRDQHERQRRGQGRQRRGARPSRPQQSDHSYAPGQEREQPLACDRCTERRPCALRGANESPESLANRTVVADRAACRAEHRHHCDPQNEAAARQHEAQQAHPDGGTWCRQRCEWHHRSPHKRRHRMREPGKAERDANRNRAAWPGSGGPARHQQPRQAAEGKQVPVYLDHHREVDDSRHGCHHQCGEGSGGSLQPDLAAGGMHASDADCGPERSQQ